MYRGIPGEVIYRNDGFPSVETFSQARKVKLPLDLTSVTLWSCVWSAVPDHLARVVRVMNYCQGIANFGGAILFTYLKPDPAPNNCEVIQIPCLDGRQWNVFHCKLVPWFITYEFTKHALSVHEDGFILHPELWDDRFLNYDYIGAPWIDDVVGNGGFCLESCRIMSAKLDLWYDNAAKCNSDQWVCRDHRKHFEGLGMRFAPQPLALKFSAEDLGEIWPSFGFHGHAAKDQRNHNKYREGWAKIEAYEKGTRQ